MSKYNYYASSIHPTAVNGGVYLRLISPTSHQLVVLRHNYLDIYTINGYTLDLLQQIPIYARILHISAISSPEAAHTTLDHLLVLTDTSQLVIIGFDQISKTCQVVSDAKLMESPGIPLSDPLLSIDEEYDTIAIHAFEFLIHFVRLYHTRGYELGGICTTRIYERNILDMSFVRRKPKRDPNYTSFTGIYAVKTADPYLLCYIYSDTFNDRPGAPLLHKIKFMKHMLCQTSSKKTTDDLYPKNSKTNIPLQCAVCTLLPLPPIFGGILAVGPQDAVYFDERTLSPTYFKINIPFNDQVVARCSLNTNSAQFLIGVASGELYMVSTNTASLPSSSTSTDPVQTALTAVDVQRLGICSTASVLAPVGDDLIYLGSRTGDSAILKIEYMGCDTQLTVVHTFNNLGPLVDFCLIENNKENDIRMVACSGVGKSSSIRVIRYGIGLEVTALITASAVRGLFGIRLTYESPNHCILIVSFVGETRVLGFPSLLQKEGGLKEGEGKQEMDELYINGLVMEATTLLASNVKDTSNFIQVTKEGVRLISLNTLTLIKLWIAPQDNAIQFASCYENLLLLGLMNGYVVLLKVLSTSFVELNKLNIGSDISCLHIWECMCAIGTWDTCEILVYSIPDFILFTREVVLQEKKSIGMRSVVICNSNQMSYLLISMGDGRIISYVLSPSPSDEGVFYFHPIESDDNQLMLQQVEGTTQDGVLASATNSFEVLETPQITDTSETLMGECYPQERQLNGAPTSTYLDLSSKRILSLSSQPIALSPLVCYKNTSMIPTGSFIETSGCSTGSHTVEHLTAQQRTQHTKVTSVFAASDQPTVIHAQSPKKLLFSKVNAHKVNQICSFHCEPLGLFNGLAWADDNQLHIGVIDDIQKLHIRTLPTDRIVDKVTYHAPSELLAVSCPGQIPSGDGCTKTDKAEFSFIRFYNASSFKLEDEFVLPENYSVTALCVVEFGGMDGSYIAAGASEITEADVNPKAGQILLFKTRPKFEESRVILSCIRSGDLGGCVTNVLQHKGKLLVSFNSTLSIHNLVEAGDQSESSTSINSEIVLSSDKYVISCEASHPVGVWIISLYARNDVILVGDVMTSISVFTYVDATKTFVELCRDHAPRWITAVSCLNDDIYLGSDSSGNFAVFERNKAASQDIDKSRLNVVGLFHHSEMINKCLPGSLFTDPFSASTKRSKLIKNNDASEYMWGSAEGGIGVVIPLNGEQQFNRLVVLENVLRNFISSFGGFSHKDWRNFRTEHSTLKTCGFVDGNLVECFLELPRRVQLDVFVAAESIFKSNGTPFISLRELVDELQELQRLH